MAKFEAYLHKKGNENMHRRRNKRPWKQEKKLMTKRGEGKGKGRKRKGRERERHRQRGRNKSGV